MERLPTTLCRRADDEESRKFSVVHEAVARTETGSAIAHGRNDIEDVRGYTSYIENWGLVRVPTLVLFRRGRARLFPWQGARWCFMWPGDFAYSFA